MVDSVDAFERSIKYRQQYIFVIYFLSNFVNQI